MSTSVATTKTQPSESQTYRNCNLKPHLKRNINDMNNFSNDNRYLLVSGYVRRQYVSSTNYHYPTALALLTIQFAGNKTKCALDLFNIKYNKMIQNSGTLISIKKQHISSPFSFGCSQYFDSGINKIRILCVEPTNDPIGITTNITECDNDKSWIFKFDGYSYGIYDTSLTLGDYTFNENYQIGIDKYWNKGDIIKICIDCNQWIVTFYVNDILIGKPFNIIQNEKYYLVMSFQRAPVQYQIIDLVIMN